MALATDERRAATPFLLKNLQRTEQLCAEHINIYNKHITGCRPGWSWMAWSQSDSPDSSLSCAICVAKCPGHSDTVLAYLWSDDDIRTHPVRLSGGWNTIMYVKHLLSAWHMVNTLCEPPWLKYRLKSTVKSPRLWAMLHQEPVPQGLNSWSHGQFSSVTQSCPTLCDPMNHSTPGLPVHHQLLEFTQTHIHWVSDAIQPSHPLSSPSPSAPNPSQHQSLFQWVNSSHEVAKVLVSALASFLPKKSQG